MPAVFPKFSGADCSVRWPGGRLGEHNAEVFGSLLGLSEAELGEIQSKGVV
jgi:formyl-CoA transferase